MRFFHTTLVLVLAFSLVQVASAVTILPGNGGILDSDDVSWSDEMREGARLVQSGNYQEAFLQFSRASAKGELIAHHMLGVMHRDGRGTPQNIKLAKQSFAKAASKGAALAEQESALLRFAAPESPDEFATARIELEALANKNLSRPQMQVGIAYLEGYGFTADTDRAIKYLSSAASGNGIAKPAAAFRLGKLYLDGLASPEVKKDTDKAESWLKIAAEEEHAPAVRALGEFYLDPSFGKQDYARARLWFSRLERLGDPAASYFMGVMSEGGLGVEKDPAAAAGYYRNAAENKVPLALYKMAQFHEHGLGGVEKDRSKAIDLYRSGAELGHAVCMYNLSGLLDETPNKSPAIEDEISTWLLRAAGSGLTEAEFQIGSRYHDGRGVTQDFVAAATWLGRAARNGHALAQLHLGEMYESGRGVERDYQAARKLFQLSTANGNLGGQVKYAAALANGIGGEQDLIAAFIQAQSATLVAPDVQVATQLRDGIKKAMTPEQIKSAEDKLATLKKAAAEKL